MALNVTKVQEFFDYNKTGTLVSIIGCGAIGSTLCEQLARIGVTEFVLYDFDTVSTHNITNQNFFQRDIGRNKAEVCKELILSINEDANVTIYTEGLKEPYTIGEGGLVCLCVDNIDLRRTIMEANKYNPMIKAWADFRMRLTDAQHYLASKKESAKVEQLYKTMQFSHEEAAADTPVSACGVALSVRYTVESIVALGVANIVKMWTGNEYRFLVMNDMIDLTTVLV